MLETTNAIDARRALASRTHAPLRFELILHCGGSEDRVAGETTDTSGTVADGSKLSSRDTALVTPDASSIAHRVPFLKLPGGCKVQTSECARLAKHMTWEDVSMSLINLSRLDLRAGENGEFLKGCYQW